MTWTPSERAQLLRRRDLAFAKKAASCWAMKHKKDTGHDVEIVCDGWHNFHVTCQECLRLAGAGRDH